MDEPSHYGDELHDLLEVMGSHLRGVSGPHVIAMTLTGNGYNAAWEILEKRQDSTGELLGIEIELVRASTLENPYIDDATKERFKRQYGDSEREEQALHGGFAAAQGLVYSNFSREAHVIPHATVVDRVEKDWRIYGYDAGWKDPRVLVEFGRTSIGQYVALDMFHEQESHVEDAIRWLDARPDGAIVCEHNPSDINRFKKAGYKAVKAEKDLEAEIADVRRRLEADESLDSPDDSGLDTGPRTRVFRMPAWRGSKPRGRTIKNPSPIGEDTPADETQDGGRDGESRAAVGLLVSERCQQLIREFLSYKEVRSGRQRRPITGSTAPAT